MRIERPAADDRQFRQRQPAASTGPVRSEASSRPGHRPAESENGPENRRRGRAPVETTEVTVDSRVALIHGTATGSMNEVTVLALRAMGAADSDLRDTMGSSNDADSGQRAVS